jgi:hypothetical protein
VATNSSSPRTGFSEVVSSDNSSLDPLAGNHQRTQGPITTPGDFASRSSEITQRQSTRRHHVGRPENGGSENKTESREPNAIAKCGGPTLNRSSGDFSTRIHKRGGKQTIVTGAFPLGYREPGVLVETIRDAENPRRMVFLQWENGSATIFHSIEREERLFVPPDPTSSSFPLLSLPDGLLPSGKPVELLAEIGSAIWKFVKLNSDQLRIVAAFVLASWFPDCFEAAPYLLVVGPLGSGKTTLLKVLWCLCRRGLIAGDLRSGSVYKLVDAWDPTLIIDELELGSSAAKVELLRLLRTGTTPGVPTFRNGRRFSTYCLKILSSRQTFGDAALSSRGLIVSVLPTNGGTPPLDDAAMRNLEKEFQPKLCNFRLQNHAAVKNFSYSQDAIGGLSARMRQIARALTAPILGHEEWTSVLLTILRKYDDEAQIERSLEPEWLVTEFLLANCHEGLEDKRGVTYIPVGGMADQINKNLEYRHEECTLSAKKTGLVLKSLGLRTRRLGNWGRGLPLTDGVRKKIHRIAARLGIDRLTIAPLTALESGCGGAPCTLCEEFGLTGGLRFE